MNYNPRILVGLDLSPIDTVILHFIRLFFDFSRLDSVYLIHISSELNAPDKLKVKPNLPADETIRAHLQHLTESVFTREERSLIKLEVRDGNPEKDLLKWSRIKDIDILVLGQKGNSENAGSLDRKMVKESNCSLLLVPEPIPEKIEQIVVAVDFSDVSQLALEQAIKLSDTTGADVICHHVYQVPSGYHKTGKTYEEFAEVMRKNAEEESEKILKHKGHTNLSFEYTLDHDENPAKILESFSRKLATDVVFIGSKGRTPAASLVLKSFAEKCVKYVDDIPLFIAKRKGENLGLIDTMVKV